MDKNVTVEWQGYQIKRGERDMLWVSKGGINPMPGACCFESEEQAKKGIAALIITNQLQAPGSHVEGTLFWSLMELAK